MKTVKNLIAIAALALCAQTFAADKPQPESPMLPQVGGARLFPSIWIGGGIASISNPNGIPIVADYVLTVQDGFGRVFNLTREAVIFGGGTYADQPFGTVVLSGAIVGWHFA